MWNEIILINLRERLFWIKKKLEMKKEDRIYFIINEIC